MVASCRSSSLKFCTGSQLLLPVRPHHRAVLAAARALHELRQAEKQRDAAVEAAFEAEGLQEYLYSDLLPGVRRFGEHGEGSVAELVADARQLRQREEGQQARFDRIRELLAAEGLQGVRSSHEEFAFIGGWISEAQALAAVRLRAQEAAACAARRGALAAALAAEGIQFECRRLDYHRLFPSARAFIDHASGSQEEGEHRGAAGSGVDLAPEPSAVRPACALERR